MKRDLDGSSILIAGGSGGLGAAIGAHLSKAGARLTLFGRDPSRLASAGLDGPKVAGDLARLEDCRAAVSAAREEYGRIDGVVNAAGVVAFGTVDTLTEKVMEELWHANFVGPVRMMLAALPFLPERGFVANLSAIVAERPTAGMAFYSATKAALTAFDQVASRELRRKKIDLIDIRPPHTETGLADRPIAGAPPRLPEGLSPDQVAERIVAAIQAGEREVAAEDF